MLEIAKGAGIHTTPRHLTKKFSGSIGNTTLHSLPGLYLFAISNAPSMLSATNATLNLAALLLTSMAIFIILSFFHVCSETLRIAAVVPILPVDPFLRKNRRTSGKDLISHPRASQRGIYALSRVRT